MKNLFPPINWWSKIFDLSGVGTEELDDSGSLIRHFSWTIVVSSTLFTVLWFALLFEELVLFGFLISSIIFGSFLSEKIFMFKYKRKFSGDFLRILTVAYSPRFLFMFIGFLSLSLTVGFIVLSAVLFYRMIKRKQSLTTGQSIFATTVTIIVCEAVFQVLGAGIY